MTARKTEQGAASGAMPPHPTVYLKERDFREKVIAVDHSVRAEYEFDAGIAIGRYLEGLKDGRIIGRACFSCRRRLVPPRMFCELCFRPTDEWIEVQSTGVVNTFSICYVTWDMRRIEDPEIPAVIELDGASKGIGIMHKLGNVDPEAVAVGMRVRAVWKPIPQREGSILDIEFFEPIERAKSTGSRAKSKRSVRASTKPRPARPKVSSKARSVGKKTTAGRGRTRRT